MLSRLRLVIIPAKRGYGKRVSHVGTRASPRAGVERKSQQSASSPGVLVWRLDMAQTQTKNASSSLNKGRGWHGDPEGHAAAGRKGGAKVSQDKSHMAEIGRRGGAKVSQDREHMAAIGRKGGEKVSQARGHMA